MSSRGSICTGGSCGTPFSADVSAALGALPGFKAAYDERATTSSSSVGNNEGPTATLSWTIARRSPPGAECDAYVGQEIEYECAEGYYDPGSATAPYGGATAASGF